MKIDIFPHILPRRYLARMLEVAPPGLALQKRIAGIPAHGRPLDLPEYRPVFARRAERGPPEPASPSSAPTTRSSAPTSRSTPSPPAAPAPRVMRGRVTGARPRRRRADRRT